VQACPPSAVYRLRKFMRRNKGPVVAATTIFLVLVGGIVGTTWGMLNAKAAAKGQKEAKDAAEQSEAKAKAALNITETNMLAMANSFEASGRAQDAIKLFEETLRLRKARLGPDHPETLISLMGLIASYAAAEAESLNSSLDFAIQLTNARDDPELTYQLMKDQLGPDHPDTLMCMNSLAYSYIAIGNATKAVAILQDALAMRERRVRVEPANRLEQAFLAWTHGEMGEVQQARLDYAAAVQAFAKSVEIFEKLDQDAALKESFFRGQPSFYRQKLRLCRKAEQATKDINFALQQPEAEVPQLLNMRAQALAAMKDQAGVVTTAEAYAKLAEKNPNQIYNAACAWSLASGVAKARSSAATPFAEECAAKALKLLKKTPTGKGQVFVTTTALAAHMTKDKDLDVLRDRDDFKKLLAEMSGNDTGKKP